MRLILATALLLSAATSLAQDQAPLVASDPANKAVTVLPDSDLSTSPTTAVMSVKHFALLKLQVRLTRGGLATDVGFTCEESDDKLVWSVFTKVEPDGSVVEFHPVHTTSVSVNFSLRLDVTGFVYFRCTLSGAASTSGDRVVVVRRRARGI